MSHIFNSQAPELFGRCDPASEDELKNEPMLYGASIQFAQEHGGKITRDITSAIFKRLIGGEISNHAVKGYHPVIDTKVMLLLPGQYPCIPGWHCDGVIRQSRGDQPNLKTLSENISHYICSLSSAKEAHCGTDIIAEHMAIPDKNIDTDKVWGSVNRFISQTSPRPTAIDTVNGDIYRFNRSTLHRGQQCKERQWRFFYRLSFYHMPAMNEVRQQVQVYADPSQGW
jgi:hypothetical protein